MHRSLTTRTTQGRQKNFLMLDYTNTVFVAQNDEYLSCLLFILNQTIKSGFSLELLTAIIIGLHEAMKSAERGSTFKQSILSLVRDYTCRKI